MDIKIQSPHPPDVLLQKIQAAANENKIYFSNLIPLLETWGLPGGKPFRLRRYFFLIPCTRFRGQILTTPQGSIIEGDFQAGFSNPYILVYWIFLVAVFEFFCTTYVLNHGIDQAHSIIPGMIGIPIFAVAIAMLGSWADNAYQPDITDFLNSCAQ